MEYLKMTISNTNKLSNRELQIIELREQKYTLLDIGHMFGVTRERIRQIEAKALKKLNIG